MQGQNDTHHQAEARNQQRQLSHSIDSGWTTQNLEGGGQHTSNRRHPLVQLAPLHSEYKLSELSDVICSHRTSHFMPLVHRAIRGSKNWNSIISYPLFIE
ncbi:uncharacterized protein LOC125501154 isoform X2 [Athalia rosae]|uniref:uncharacterized protein LOC125501154 isoform X2 n=1 Tax=Athalia rosae TaxID=37344 RepID=UPI0020336C55|nr:uncharacterized protein LOC125501154 isoform X2 [Athalia rosae]